MNIEESKHRMKNESSPQPEDFWEDYDCLQVDKYCMPVQLYEDVVAEVEEIARGCIDGYLIDEFTVEDINQSGDCFLDRLIQSMFKKIYNHLARQKLAHEEQILAMETFIEKELCRINSCLMLARSELEECKQCLEEAAEETV